MTKQHLLIGIAAMVLLIIVSTRQLQSWNDWRPWVWVNRALAVIALVVMVSRWRRAS